MYSGAAHQAHKDVQSTLERGFWHRITQPEVRVSTAEHLAGDDQDVALDGFLTELGGRQAKVPGYLNKCIERPAGMFDVGHAFKGFEDLVAAAHVGVDLR